MLMLTKTRGLWHRQILQALATHGPLSTRQIHQLFPNRHEASVQPACKRLQQEDLVSRRYIIQNKCQAVEWSLTDAGYALLETLKQSAIEKPTIAKQPQPAVISNARGKKDELEDDGWVPQPWIHPYRKTTPSLRTSV